MNRIIDANLNRATEALRVIEEIARFIINDKEASGELKNIRHKLCTFFDKNYDDLIKSRDTQNDVGVDILNPTLKENKNLESIFRSNFKRLEQALRVLSEYSNLSDDLRYKSYTIEKKMSEKIKMDIKKYLLKDKKLYLVTNSDKYQDENEFLDRVAQAVKAGVDIVQLREKNLNTRQFVKYAKAIRQICSEYGALFIINDRVDIAQIVQADGVHLGQEDIDIKSAREILGEKMIIGISTHKPQDAIEAMEQGADYIGVGPIFKTPTKPNKEPVGLEYLKWAKENVSIPFFAIGSIDETSVDEVVSAQVDRIALIRAVMDSQNIGKTVKFFKEKLNK